jgi:hypothetical protein
VTNGAQTSPSALPANQEMNEREEAKDKES